MNHEERVSYCKVCIHRKMDFQQGLLCSLTNEKPNFDKFCSDFKRDIASEKRQKERKEESKWANGSNSKVTFKTVLYAILLIFVVIRLLIKIFTLSQ